jgi:polo-like kinase 1
MSQEIAIHRSIRHNHIVEFHTYFEDKDYIYIVLELCSKRVSIKELN